MVCARWKPSPLVRAAAVGQQGFFFRVYFFSNKDPGPSCCRQEEQGERRVPDERSTARLRPPARGHAAPQEAEPHRRGTRRPRAPPPPAATARCWPASGMVWPGGQAHPRPRERAGPRSPFPPARLPVPGLRLQHWNKTQHYITFLFVHLNVYLELHFVRNLPSFYSWLTEVFTDF